MKLKVGSASLDRDLRRIEIVRETVGRDIRLMVDANQQWTLPQALEFGRRVKDFDLYWIEEPTHPDDVHAHGELARAIAPIKLAAGEHLAQSRRVQELFPGGLPGILPGRRACASRASANSSS